MHRSKTSSIFMLGYAYPHQVIIFCFTVLLQFCIQFYAYVYQEWKTDLLWWNLDCGYAKLFNSSPFLQISKLCISKWSSRISHPVNSEELYMFKQNKWYRCINHCYTNIYWFVKNISPEIHRIIFFMTIKSISNFVQVTVFLFFFTKLQRLYDNYCGCCSNNRCCYTVFIVLHCPLFCSKWFLIL